LRTIEEQYDRLRAFSDDPNHIEASEVSPLESRTASGDKLRS
jgi:hypothetical protein